MKILSLIELTKHFGGLAAVNHLRMSVEEGEIFGIIGPNGAGKTTLFNLISGFYAPTSGDILFRGESILNLKPHMICQRGLTRTFQLTKPFSSLSVFDNIKAAAYNRSKTRNEAEKLAVQALELSRMKGRENSLAGILNIPDRKRLELARAIATKPDILLLDEVMAGLNPTAMSDVMEIIMRIRNMGITVLVIEHVMKAIMSLSDRIVVLNHGEKIAEGTPREISENNTVIEAYLGKDYLHARSQRN